jgi:hypothetical protein
MAACLREGGRAPYPPGATALADSEKYSCHHLP